ncbi:hypothetical protein ACS0TY_017741 [Phlomoides rotata]
MEVFSPIVEIQPITTPSLDKLWDDRDGPKKDTDRKPSFLFPSRRFGLSEESANDNHQIFDWKSNSSSKQDSVLANQSTTSLMSALTLPRRFSSYAERISAAPSFSDALSFLGVSPKSKKTGAETREEQVHLLPLSCF